MKLHFKSLAVLVGMAFGALSVQAQSSLITFSVDMSSNANFNPANGDFVSVQGTFNGWSPFIQLYQVGSTSIYTNTYNDTSEANGTPTKYQFVVTPAGNHNNDSYETSADYNLRAARLPATSGASLILSTPFYNDAGAAISNNVTFQVDMAQQIALTNFVVGSNTVEVRGNFNGWTGGVGTLTNVPSIRRTNQYGLISSNVYVGTFPVVASTNAAIDFKYVIATTNTAQFEQPNSTNNDNGGNRFFVNSNNFSLPIVYFSDQPYAPLVTVNFSVDMAAVLLSDSSYNPSTVTLDGSFNGWTADVAVTNNPAASNTNIYSTTLTIGAGSTIYYQYRYQDSGGTVYDNPTGGGNRSYTVPGSNSVIPTVFFDDVSPADLLSVATSVTFSVNMTNAVGTDAYTFNPANGDSVYINGDFLGWQAWNPIALSASQMTESNTTEIYTFTYNFPVGHARVVNYKYSINGNDDEGGFGQNHVRYIRSTNGVYNMPLDKFGVITQEPKFGNLAINNATGSVIPVTWLGYPGVTLQYRTNLSTGSWVTLSNTTGLSATNFPNTGKAGYFRLVQPYTP